MKIIILIITVSIFSSALTWHRTGHMLVAQIAQTVLQQTEQGTKLYEKALNLLAPFSKYCGEKDDPFIEAAVWPDKLFGDKVMQMFSWHFVDQIISTDGTPIKSSVYEENTTPYNVTHMINACVETLRHPDSVPNQGATDKTLMKSLMLRNLLHFVGDVHQPLHGCGGVSKDTPDSDQGGNLFKITDKEHPEVSELHFIWDAAFFQFPVELNSPMDPETRHLPEQYAKELMERFTKEHFDELGFDTKTINPGNWANESYKYCQDSVYETKFGEELRPEYKNMGKMITAFRITLAGYRLAETLKVALVEKDFVENFEKELLVKKKAFLVKDE